LTAILHQVGHNFTEAKRGIDIGNEIEEVFTKFDKQQILKKRAFSMEDLTGENKSNDDTRSRSKSDLGEDSDDYIFKRRYSFPLEGLEEDVLDPGFGIALN